MSYHFHFSSLSRSCIIGRKRTLVSAVGRKTLKTEPCQWPNDFFTSSVPYASVLSNGPAGTREARGTPLSPPEFWPNYLEAKPISSEELT